MTTKDIKISTRVKPEAHLVWVFIWATKKKRKKSQAKKLKRGSQLASPAKVHRVEGPPGLGPEG
jgi:hypothetical protein